MEFPKPIDNLQSKAGASRHGWPWTGETNPGIYLQKSNWPRISIITPSYNQGEFLEQTIRSVLLQNYPNLEYILIDGGSWDRSIEVIKKYGPWIDYWVSESDSGQSDALNKGFRQASGEIVAWINSDDFYEKDTFFKVALAYMDNHFSFLCGACKMIDSEGRVIQDLFTSKISFSSLLKYWKPHFCPPQPSMFFQNNCLRTLGGFDVRLKYSMDFDLWLKASKKYSFQVVKDHFSNYRIHSQSKTGSEGGFRKFIPEWKTVIGRSLEQESPFTRWNYKLQERGAIIRSNIRSLFNRSEMKTIARKLLIKESI